MAGYAGYFFQITSGSPYIFPMKHIAEDSYDSAPAQRQSLDAYTDENGETHDNPQPHTKTEIKFKTLPMSEKEWDRLMGNVVSRYINPLARDLNLYYYDFEARAYKSGHFYLDKSFRTGANDRNGKLAYRETDWLFIEY